MSATNYIEWDPEVTEAFLARFGRQLPSGVVLSNPVVTIQERMAVDPETWGDLADVTTSNVGVVDDDKHSRPSQAVQFQIDGEPATRPAAGNGYRALITADRSDGVSLADAGKIPLRIRA